MSQTRYHWCCCPHCGKSLSLTLELNESPQPITKALTSEQKTITYLKRTMGMFADEANWKGETWSASIRPWTLAQKSLAERD